MWQEHVPEPQPPAKKKILRHGKIRLIIVGPDAPSDTRQFQHLLLDIGRFSDSSEQECMQTWPREALALARQELDDLERYLERNQ